MYEIFGVAYGWQVGDINGIATAIGDLEGFVDLGGTYPYSGGGPPTIYIGIQIDKGTLDCGRVLDPERGLPFHKFVDDVLLELAHLRKTHKYLKDVARWKRKLLEEADNLLQEGHINKSTMDVFAERLSEEPQLFWTWETS